MKNPIRARKFNPITRNTNSFVLLLLLFGITPTAIAEVAQAPLYLTTTVKPNVMLMLDNSISMGDTLTVSSSGTSYDPANNYLNGANCNTNSLPTTTTSTSVNTSLNTSTRCTSAGGSWSRSNNRCTVTTTTALSYGTSIPTTFFGKVTGSGRTATTGTKCFASTLTYTTSLSIPPGVTTNAQRANYLNWYYSNLIAISGTTTTRLQLAKNAANALVDSLTGNVRLGFSTFNVDDGGKLWEVIDDLGTTKKSNIKNRITATNNDAHTPLAETMADIGNYFATGSSNVTLHAGESNASTQTKSAVLPSALINGTTWTGRTSISGEPTFSSNPIQYSCQKSFAVLLTDGLPSSDQAISTNTYLNDYDGDCTGSNSSQCTGSYDMKKAYGYPGGNGGSGADYRSVSGGGSNSSDYLDDVTKALYEMDLRPDIAKTGGAKNNITTYVIGFADDAINPNVAGVNPLPKDAALQGGGQFFYAGNEAELTASLISTFQFIIEKGSASSSVTSNSTKFQTDTIIYQATFDSKDWSGKLLAIKLLTEDLNGNNILDTSPINEDVNGNGKIDTGIIGPQQWDASALIPNPSARHIYSYNPAATTTKGIEFLWANLNATQKQVLDNANVSATSSPILDYLRGDQSHEVTNSGDYRIRSSVLGDIINSDPLFVGQEDLGYSSLAGPEGSNYIAFRASTTSRLPMIYAGANDGMLHGFDASIGTDGGTEIFAYLPNAVISSELVELTSPNYNHRYFVDGSPQYGDAYFNSGWHTVLVGSMGAGSTTIQSGTSGTGGRALFALDVTNPDDFLTPTTGAGKVLWEFSSRDDADLGYTLPQPGIVRMANGKWAAIVANGYNSTSGKAVLFVIDIENGSIIKKIEAGTAGANGLSSPVAVDTDNDKIVNYIYAGDLKGNLWKFDVSNSNAANWGVAYSGAPLFVATDKATSSPQPITSKPTIGKATAPGQSGGVMIYFGTGKYFESTDNTVGTQVQSFYGLWDDNTGAITGRAGLQEQTIDFEGAPVNASGTAGTGIVRVTSRKTVCYSTSTVALANDDTPVITCSSTNLKKGWVMDLLKPVNIAQGERVVSPAQLYSDLVIFSTLIPSAEACAYGGESRLMLVEALTGKRPASSSFDLFGGSSTARDSKVGIDDLVMVNGHLVAASGLSFDIGIHKNISIVGNKGFASGSGHADGASGSAGGAPDLGEVTLIDDETPCSGTGCGTSPAIPGKRISWRQLR